MCRNLGLYFGTYFVFLKDAITFDPLGQTARRSAFSIGPPNEDPTYPVPLPTMIPTKSFPGFSGSAIPKIYGVLRYEAKVIFVFGSVYISVPIPEARRANAPTKIEDNNMVYYVAEI